MKIKFQNIKPRKPIKNKLVLSGDKVPYSEAIHGAYNIIHGDNGMTKSRKGASNYIDYVTKTALNPVTGQYEMKTVPKINWIKLTKYICRNLVVSFTKIFEKKSCKK